MNDIVAEIVARFTDPIPAPASIPTRSDGRTPVFTESTAFLAADAGFFSSPAERTSIAGLTAFIDNECDGAITGVHFLNDVPDAVPGTVPEFRYGAPDSGDDLFVMYDVPTDTVARTVHDRVATTAEKVVELARRGVHAIRFPSIGPYRDDFESIFPAVAQILDTIAPWLSVVIDAEWYSGASEHSRKKPIDHDTFESCLIDVYRTEDARVLSQWAVTETGPATDFVRYNVLSSPVGSLSGSALVDAVLPSSQRARTFLSAYTVLMALPGVPGVRLDAFIPDGVSDAADHSVPFDRFVDSLHEAETLAAAVFAGVTERLRVRGREPAFLPRSRSRVLNGSPEVISIVRGVGDEPNVCTPVICLHNIAHTPSDPAFTAEELSVDDSSLFRDLISGDLVYPYRTSDGRFAFGLEPYESMWLKAFAP